MERLAPAKVNLFLEVLGRRPDGYHQIVTVMHAVDLCDRLSFRKKRRGFELRGAEGIRGKNLVQKAFEAVARACRLRAGLDVRLDKRIPVGAGLGGGSSDAAATILAMNALYRLDLAPHELDEIAASVGSDVPFFLRGGTALCTGRGEIVTQIKTPKPLHFVIAVPNFECPTPRVYARLKRRLTGCIRDANKFLRVLSDGDLRRLEAGLFNRLEEASFEMFPVLARLKKRMMQLGFAGVLMSGSGSALFGLCGSPAQARALSQAGARWFAHTFPVKSFIQEDTACRSPKFR